MIEMRAAAWSLTRVVAPKPGKGGPTLSANQSLESVVHIHRPAHRMQRSQYAAMFASEVREKYALGWAGSRAGA